MWSSETPQWPHSSRSQSQDQTSWGHVFGPSFGLQAATFGLGRSRGENLGLGLGLKGRAKCRRSCPLRCHHRPHSLFDCTSRTLMPRAMTDFPLNFPFHRLNVLLLRPRSEERGISVCLFACSRTIVYAQYSPSFLSSLMAWLGHPLAALR